MTTAHMLATQTYEERLQTLSEGSVRVNFNAFRDIPWDDPAYAIIPNDPRWVLPEVDPLGGSDWYQSLPLDRQIEIGLGRMANICKVGWQFENILIKGVLEYLMDVRNGSAEFRYLMFTLGFGWKPWDGDRAIADGPDILAYLKDAARETGVDQRIRYHHKVTKASWSTADKRWTLDVEHADTGETSQLTADFVWWTSGYYDYDEAYTPEFPGIGDFKGTVVHPQFWPDDLDYTGKEVVVIGSGATAVTLIPSMSQRGSGYAPGNRSLRRET